jgi:hypothetical protein
VSDWIKGKKMNTSQMIVWVIAVFCAFTASAQGKGKVFKKRGFFFFSASYNKYLSLRDVKHDFDFPSWKSNEVHSAFLKHEQAHFDITEIYARKFTAQMKLYEEYRKPDLMDITFKI